MGLAILTGVVFVGSLIMRAIAYSKISPLQKELDELKEKRQTVDTGRSVLRDRMAYINKINALIVPANGVEIAKSKISALIAELAALALIYNSLYPRYRRKKDEEEAEEARKRRERQRQAAALAAALSSSSSSRSSGGRSSWSGGGGGFSGGGASGSW